MYPSIQNLVRQYEPIWEALKKNKTVSITANRVLHPRIIKAVIKEKWSDIGYKINIEPRRAVLSYTKKHSVLTFTLSLTANSITGADL